MADKKGRPTEVDICGWRWTIEWLKPKDWASEDNGLSGVTYAMHLQIKILLSPNIHPEVLREVLFHELMHACVATSGHTYGLKHIKNKDVEEVMIQGLSPALLAVLHNNSEVRRYLLDG